MIELWLLAAVLGAVALITSVFLTIQHYQRSGEAFIALEAEALADVSHLPRGTPITSGAAFDHSVSGRLRFRYVWRGRERIGEGTNPWGLPAVPQLLPGGRLRIHYSEARDDAYVDVRTTLIPARLPLRLGVALLVLAGLGFWLSL